MKLYTEKQVREMLEDMAYISLKGIDDYMSEIAHIELPSDEEVWEKIEYFPYSIDYDTGFMQGVKWVIEQIKQQDNGK